MFNTIHTYRSFSMSNNDYSLGRLRMKTKDEPKEGRISKYELREFLSYHKREISYTEFHALRKKMLGTDFSNIIDHLEELQEKLEAYRFKVNKIHGYRFVHLWFKRTSVRGYFEYSFCFNDKGKLYQIDYDIK